MDSLSRDELRELAEASGEPIVSLYMPTHRAGREVRQNATRFGKKLLKQAAQQVHDRFPEASALEERLAEAKALQSDDNWWQHQSDGLAVIISPQRLACYRLPFEFEESVTVGVRPYLRPLVRVVQGDGRFLILAVSQNRVRLLEGTQSKVEELQPDELPTDLRSALNIDEYVSTLQQHTGQPTGNRRMMFHGQGAADLDIRKKDEITQYFRVISRALATYLGPGNAPLVFSGVDYLFPMFRDAYRSPRLLGESVAGNPDELSPAELHAKAWGVVEPYFAADRQEAVDQFERGMGNQRATSNLEDLLQAAEQGAVETLLLAEGEARWGVVRTEPGTGTVFDFHAMEGAEELLNYAAIKTLTTGGTVYSLPAEAMPDANPAAAVLRFPTSATREP